MSFINDISNLKALQSVPPGLTNQNARVLAFIHNKIPCKQSLLPEGGRAVPIPFTVLQPLTAGFSTAPYYIVNSSTPLQFLMLTL